MDIDRTKQGLLTDRVLSVMQNHTPGRFWGTRKLAELVGLDPIDDRHVLRQALNDLEGQGHVIEDRFGDYRLMTRGGQP